MIARSTDYSDGFHHPASVPPAHGHPLRSPGHRDRALPGRPAGLGRASLPADPGRCADQPGAWHLRGVLAHNLGKHEDAVECIRCAIGLSGEVADFHNSLGEAYRALGRAGEALDCYRRALALEPDFVEAYTNQGIALKDLGRSEEAIACHRRALELNPHLAVVHNNLGNALASRGNLDEAIAAFRRALELTPGYARAHNNLGTALKDQGRLDEALSSYRRALELEPGLAATHSNLLLTLQYCRDLTPAALADAHAEFDRRHAVPLGPASAPCENLPDPRGRLRLGFVSPDLGRHPVGYFLVRVLENVDQQQLETICYSDRFVKDDVTQRLQVAATQWRDTRGMNDQQLAEQIRSDRIDILFDLAGTGPQPAAGLRP